MKKLYISSILSTRTTIGGQTITHGPSVVYATSKEEAVGKFLLIAEEKYPPSQGWSNSVSVVKLTEFFVGLALERVEQIEQDAYVEGKK